jgi:hypothetical protein
MQRLIGSVPSLVGRVARRLFRRQVAINRSLSARLEALEQIPRVPPPDVRPILERLAALERRQEAVEQRADSSLALGWDHVALARRLAEIEDRLEAIEADRASGDARAA